MSLLWRSAPRPPWVPPPLLVSTELHDRPGGSMSYSALSHLECSRTGDPYDADQVQGVSSRCAAAGALRPRAGAGERRARGDRRAAARPWRYHEVLPVRDPANVTTLGGGDDAAAPVADVWSRDRRSRVADEGRGADPDRDLQGPRGSGRRLPGARARREGRGDADERQRRRRWSVTRPRRAGQPDRDAGRRPGITRASVWSRAPSCTSSTG